MVSIQVLHFEKPKPDKCLPAKVQYLWIYQLHHMLNLSRPHLSVHSLLTVVQTRWHPCLHWLLILLHPSLLPYSLHWRMYTSEQKENTKKAYPSHLLVFSCTYWIIILQCINVFSSIPHPSCSYFHIFLRVRASKPGCVYTTPPL